MKHYSVKWHVTIWQGLCVVERPTTAFGKISKGWRDGKKRKCFSGALSSGMIMEHSGTTKRDRTAFLKHLKCDDEKQEYLLPSRSWNFKR